MNHDISFIQYVTVEGTSRTLMRWAFLTASNLLGYLVIGTTGLVKASISASVCFGKLSVTSPVMLHTNPYDDSLELPVAIFAS